MNLAWINCMNNEWCSFLEVNLNHNHFDNMIGVYIIWSGDVIVRIGSGEIKSRIYDHRNNPEITNYHNLKVTWAEVNQYQMHGVEAYLANTLNPQVGERFPDTAPIEVNLPIW